MTPISKTAFYCCGARMEDARRMHSICSDSYAELFMNDYGLDIFSKFSNDWMCRLSMVLRHRIMDDILAELLADDPRLQIVTLGCGFDSRPFRIKGGSWFEIDARPLIEHKNEKLPTRLSPNPVRRFSTDFGTRSMREILANVTTDAPVVFVLEGVILYLSAREICRLLFTLRQLFPSHLLLCDLVSARICTTYGSCVAATLKKIGVRWNLIDAPQELIASNRYDIVRTRSVLETAIDLGLSPCPKFLIRIFYPDEMQGNAIYLFKTV